MSGSPDSAATPTTVTRIGDAAWVAAWDRDSATHHYLKNVDVVLEGDRIGHIGPGYRGPIDTEVDGRERFVMPGLIDVHAHPSTEPLKKGFREEFGNPLMYMSPLYDRSFMLQTDAAGQRICLQYALWELLRSGVTSIVDLSFPYEGWMETMADTGVRAWLVPSYASARWSTGNGHSVDYLWDEARGMALLDEAVAVGRSIEQHPSGRLAAMLGPAQIDTCTEELLLTSLAAARDHRWTLHTHASQSLVEFQEMTRRHGTTPVQWAADIGLLGPDCILAHAIFTDEHGWTRWPGRIDRGLLADSGTGVAHCPGVFARNGQVLEDLGGYLRSGVRLGIGTDSFPHNMLEEMRQAAILARVATGDVASVTTAEVFAAATVGGADLLGRADLGRLAVGAKADVVLVDLTNPAMQPIRDPLRSLIYTAADRAVSDVFVDGRHVVAGGQVTTIDIEAITAGLAAVRDRAEQSSAAHHFAGRSASEVSPLSLPVATFR
ncbi:MAG: amidohydrolase family protein [Acidimicrobiales bacterium]